MSTIYNKQYQCQTGAFSRFIQSKVLQSRSLNFALCQCPLERLRQSHLDPQSQLSLAIYSYSLQMLGYQNIAYSSFPLIYFILR